MGYTDHFKKNVKWYSKKKKKNWEKAKCIKQILPNGNTNYGGNDDQNWENRNTSIDHTKHEIYDIDIIRKPNQKLFGQLMYQNWRKNNSICHNRIKTRIFGIKKFQI